MEGDPWDGWSERPTNAEYDRVGRDPTEEDREGELLGVIENNLGSVLCDP